MMWADTPNSQRIDSDDDEQLKGFGKELIRNMSREDIWIPVTSYEGCQGTN